MRRKLVMLADVTGAVLVVGTIAVACLFGDEAPVPLLGGINLAIVAVCILRFWAWEPSVHRSSPDERSCR